MCLLGVSWGSWVLLGVPGGSWVALGTLKNPSLKAVKKYRRYYDTLLSKNSIWRALVARGSFGDFLVGFVLGVFWVFPVVPPGCLLGVLAEY